MRLNTERRKQKEMERRTNVDTEILSEQIQVERKIFSFALRENQRGRFLRITEDVGGKRDTIIIPATGLERVRDVIDRAIAANNEAEASKVTAS